MRDAVVSCFKQYATFKGRARRSEFWFFFLFVVIVGIVTGAVDGALFGAGTDDPTPFNTVASLVLLVPSLAVGWRRMHDTDRHGAKYLIGLIPVVGWILVIIWAAQDSQPGVNRFGPSPKGGYGPGYGYPQQGQYGQPQHGQPQYGQPQYGQPQDGQPQYGEQPRYGQPRHGEQPRYGQAPPQGQDPHGQAYPYGQDGTR